MISGDPSEVVSIGGSQVGQGIPLEVAPEHFRGVEFRSIGWKEELMNPGSADQRRQQEAALVDKDDVGLQSAGFFKMSGHSTRTQRRMAFSSRSRARRSGFCGLHPMECRSLPI